MSSFIGSGNKWWYSPLTTRVRALYNTTVELTPLLKHPQLTDELRVSMLNSVKNGRDAVDLFREVEDLSFDSLLSIYQKVSPSTLRMQVVNNGKYETCLKDEIIKRAAIIEPDLPTHWIEGIFQRV